ncbi:uncharacterized protein N7477_005570 [Penicillium maclennaniae]|uniref:uncharacterized protein n=1 Tax=Penicillium maclennaniae TaxID=1343394 RepID=UPI00253F6C09|nr:uncharacterized protein N7477_005570 [Penicillium maclennaniae]KAJ5670207.1 hypothetical protein N7477_005570 [Penicillium maclennaniae]
MTRDQLGPWQLHGKESLAAMGMNNTPTAGRVEPEQQLACSTAVDTPQASYPSHPITQLQGPFEESILEANKNLAELWAVEIDAQTRRRDLLENDEYERLCGRKWRQRAEERYHPFWKLVSQMVYGVHLLVKRLAKSDLDVMKILQGHVDELDGFLQRTTEDFMIIHLDVRTRIQYLSLPLANLDVFDEMLQDRNFRLSLVSYNDQIEHAVDRFTLTITDSLKDLHKGKEAMAALWYYMRQQANEGCFETGHLSPFYQTMRDNIEGWFNAIAKLRRRGEALSKALGKLAFAVTEMQRRVGVASRKDVQSMIKTTSKGPTRTLSISQRLLVRRSGTPGARTGYEKPLPGDPFLQPQTPRPASRPASQTVKMPTAKRDRNLNDAKATKRESVLPKVINRAKSCSALVAGRNSIDSDATMPRTPGRLTKRLSKPFLTRRSASEKTEIPQNRPFTAPARTLKSRSASIGQLKVIWANDRLQTQQSMARSPHRSRRQAPHFPNGSETMKDQISHFLKTDRVVEAWENITTKADCYGQTLIKTKEWPSSIFRAKSSEGLRAQPSKSGHSAAGLGRQLSWVQEPDFLNTYSFKQKPKPSPRIHVLSVQLVLDEELIFAQESEEASDMSAETGSMITALPALPPTPASISSVAIEYRPRTVDCA